MKRFFAVLAVSAACLALTINAAPQALPVLYDSSIKTPAPNASPAEIARVYSELLRVGGTQLKRGCFKSKLFAKPELMGLARGAFTRKGVVEFIWLFKLCYKNLYEEDIIYGLAIVEKQQVVRVLSIVLPDFSRIDEFYSLRDINLNSLDELALVWVLLGRYTEEARLTLIEQTLTLGELSVYKLNRIRYTKADVDDHDWKVFVLKASIPTFIATPASYKGSPVKLTLDKAKLELRSFNR